MENKALFENILKKKTLSKLKKFSTGGNKRRRRNKLTNIATKDKGKDVKKLQALARKNARRALAKKIMNKNYDDLTSTERKEFTKKKQHNKELYKRMIDDEFSKIKAKYTMSILKNKNKDKK